MRLEQFEHLLAAAAEVTGQDEFVGVRSRAILGTFDEPPDSILQSMEAEIYPKRVPEAADLIDGNLGDGSQFHAAFGYYAHGVGPETAKAPRGWQERVPFGQGACTGEPQLLDQSVLQGLVCPLDPTLGLARIGADDRC